MTRNEFKKLLDDCTRAHRVYALVREIGTYQDEQGASREATAADRAVMAAFDEVDSRALELCPLCKKRPACCGLLCHSKECAPPVVETVVCSACQRGWGCERH